ncbi:MAG TPA: acyltransferase family protein [Marmoricola sp.]|nr:acyltransferase family protein [Marmoricola sp.]
MTTLRSRAVLSAEPTDAPPRAEPPDAARPTGRDPWFDNIKMTIVTLVVVGHSLTLLPHNLVQSSAYTFLYAWHVPAFVIVTGHLSRSFAWTPAKLIALVRTVAVPYVIFEAALAAFRYGVGGVKLDDLFADPHWPMWYLSALFFWRLMAPAFLRLPKGPALVVAVAISLVAGMYATNILDMARIFGLLPFFVLGLRLGDREWAWARCRRAVPWALVGFAAVLVFTVTTDSWIATEWYYYRSRYDALEPNSLDAIGIRALLLLVGLIGAVSCFALVPRVRGWFSTLGAATLVVYLFHGFFVLTAQYEGFPDWADQHVFSSFALTTTAAVLLALVLAAPPVARMLNVAVDPVGWLVRHRPGREPATA